MRVLDKPLCGRIRKKKTSSIVLHATGGSTLCGALETLRKKGFSYHYLIDKCGEVIQCVKNELVAFHAGKSNGPEGASVNEYSIGVSLVNKNNGKDPYTEVQQSSLQSLLEKICSEVQSIKYITSHRQISWPRKNDPVGFEHIINNLAQRLKLVYWKNSEVPVS